MIFSRCEEMTKVFEKVKKLNWFSKTINPFIYSNTSKRYYSLTFYKQNTNIKIDKYVTIKEITNSLNKKSKEYNLVLKTNLNYLKNNLETINKLKITGIYIVDKQVDIKIMADILENLKPSIVIYKCPNINKINKELLKRNTYQGFNKSILNTVKREIILNVKEDDYAIDATLGNGYDTLFLASILKKGQVISFDIQKRAINNSKKLLQDSKNVTLIWDSHENINKLKLVKKPKVILFNLGYLPGGDKLITTKAKTTIKALQASLQVLEDNGLLLVVIYPGHKEGKKEEKEIIKWLNKEKINYEIKRNTLKEIAPFLIEIRKD